ncbi:MAG: toxin-antitoxin system HicB family antitoxin [Armatimonadetes bacterium]|nr:toxin-antitoxin system HicB family antitoxin [Armatimonadota bacterium]
MAKQKANAIQENEASRYTVLLRPCCEDGELLYEATFRELGDSLVVVGEDPAKTVEELFRQGREAISEMIQEGQAVPQPRTVEPWEHCSGKLTLRITKQLHYKLRTIADDQDVSLNSLVAQMLAEAATRATAPRLALVEQSVIYKFQHAPQFLSSAQMNIG